jgi:hypothetical protein
MAATHSKGTEPDHPFPTPLLPLAFYVTVSSSSCGSVVMLNLKVAIFFAAALVPMTMTHAATVPRVMQGTWGKHGRCDLAAERLKVTRQRAGWGNGPFKPVQYDPQFRAIFWNEEGMVDNFVLGRSSSILIHNTQGFHMDGEEGYARCNSKPKRLSWPPANVRFPPNCVEKVRDDYLEAGFEK